MLEQLATYLSGKGFNVQTSVAGTVFVGSWGFFIDHNGNIRARNAYDKDISLDDNGYDKALADAYYDFLGWE